MEVIGNFNLRKLSWKISIADKNQSEGRSRNRSNCLSFSSSYRNNTTQNVTKQYKFSYTYFMVVCRLMLSPSFCCFFSKQKKKNFGGSITLGCLLFFLHAYSPFQKYQKKRVYIIPGCLLFY